MSLRDLGELERGSGMKRKTTFEQSKAGANGQSSRTSDVAELNAGKRTRILIVEDEPAMVAGLRDNFEFEGYEVISADNGVSGLERALGDDPDLVVLDVMMPQMSGLDVCKQLKAKRPSVPIMVATSAPAWISIGNSSAESWWNVNPSASASAMAL